MRSRFLVGAVVISLSSVLGAASPGHADPGPLAFAQYRAPGNLDFAHLAGETSIGVNPRTNAALFLMRMSTARVTWDDTMVPATATWTDVSWTPEGLPPDAHSLDPILWTDQQTGRAFEAQLLGPGSAMGYTDDDGATWSFISPAFTGSFDHQTVGGGAHAVSTPLSALYPDATYYCAQALVIAQCARSDNGGLTWGAPVPITTAADCSTIHGHVVSAPNGQAFVPFRSCGSGGPAIVRSEDDGLTWTLSPSLAIPPSSMSDPDIAFDAGGRMYFAASSYNSGTQIGAQYVATSDDGGRTWSDPLNLSGALGLLNAEFPMVVAGDAGRAAVVFYGTMKKGNDTASTFTGAWHIYVSSTFDGGATWSTTDMTGDDPVDRGYLRTNQRDFQDATIDAQGRIVVGYADGCTSAACRATTGKVANATDSWGTVARQTTGARLYAAFDPA